MQNELFSQGLTLMALGMGVVFVFLALLVITTKIMSRFIGRYFPESLATPVSVDSQTQHDAHIPDPHTIAIIQAAIYKHRQP